MYVYQIEVSNVCSLTCGYCPHPVQQRPKSLMSAETFGKCVELYRRSENKNELWLHNFGEAVLHPQLPDFIAYAKERGVSCSFFTNGMRNKKDAVERETWARLAGAGLERVSFSAHQMAADDFHRVVDGLLVVDKVFDPVPANLKTWAGQVGVPETPTAHPCLFQRRNAFVVLWDGRVSACCLDVEGQRKGLHIDDLLAGREFHFEPIPLCGGCDSMRDDEDM